MAPRIAFLLFLAALCASPGPAVEVSAASPAGQENNNDRQPPPPPQASFLGPSAPLLPGRIPVQQQPSSAAMAGIARYAPYESNVETYMVPRRGRRGGRGGGGGGGGGGVVVAKSAADVAAAPSASSSSPSPSPAPAPRAVIFLPPAPPSAAAASRSARKLLQNTRLETSLQLASDLTGPVSPTTGSALGWAGAAVPALRSKGELRGLGAKGGCTACVVSIENAGPLKVQTRDLNDGVATLSNLASMYRTYYLSSLERRNG